MRINENLQELEQTGREYRAHLHLLHGALLHASRSAYREYLRNTCGWAIEVTEIMLSLIEGSTGPLPDYAKKEIDTFTDKIAQEYSIQLELMTYECYQKLLTHKDAMSQSKRVGDRKTEDKASTKERTEDAEDGYVGPTYDAQEEKKQKVKERHTKERVRRKEQSKKRVPYETFVTLNGLQGATHLNGQRGRVMDKKISTGRYPVKLGNGTLLSIKEENMIREGTKGAEGKYKGNERKEFDQHRRRQRKLKKTRSAKTHWKKNKVNKPHSRQGHKDIIVAHRNVLELPSARELRIIICSKRNVKRKGRTGSTDIHLVSHIYRNSIDSENREDRVKTTFKSREGIVHYSKRNWKRKSRNGSTDVYLLQRTIELEID